MALYVENAEANEYEILRWGDLQISEAAIWINLNTPDPVDRELFQDVRFRRAMSLAINRERVNDTLYFGQGQATRGHAAAGRIALLQGRVRPRLYRPRSRPSQRAAG